MMVGVLPSPECVWGIGDHAAEAAKQIVEAARLEKGVVAAIVLHDEKPHDKASGWHSQCHG
jgi:hypothetical protein